MAGPAHRGACKSCAITVKEAELFTAVIAHKAAVQSKKRSQVDVRIETSSSLMPSATTSVVAKRSKGPDPVFGAASGFAQHDHDHGSTTTTLVRTMKYSGISVSGQIVVCGTFARALQTRKMTKTRKPMPSISSLPAGLLAGLPAGLLAGLPAGRTQYLSV
jgi:hypothetical protein